MRRALVYAVAALEGNDEAMAHKGLYEEPGNRRDAYVARNLISAAAKPDQLAKLDPLAVAYSLGDLLSEHGPVIPFSLYQQVLDHSICTYRHASDLRLAPSNLERLGWPRWRTARCALRHGRITELENRAADVQACYQSTDAQQPASPRVWAPAPTMFFTRVVVQVAARSGRSIRRVGAALANAFLCPDPDDPEAEQLSAGRHTNPLRGDYLRTHTLHADPGRQGEVIAAVIECLVGVRGPRTPSGSRKSSTHPADGASSPSSNAATPRPMAAAAPEPQGSTDSVAPTPPSARVVHPPASPITSPNKTLVVSPVTSPKGGEGGHGHRDESNSSDTDDNKSNAASIDGKTDTDEESDAPSGAHSDNDIGQDSGSGQQALDTPPPAAHTGPRVPPGRPPPPVRQPRPPPRGVPAPPLGAPSLAPSVSPRKTARLQQILPETAVALSECFSFVEDAVERGVADLPTLYSTDPDAVASTRLASHLSVGR